MKKLLVITGISGAGKTSAMRHLEDLGFYCIDNVPANLVPDIVNLLKENPEIDRAALVLDARSLGFKSLADDLAQKLKSLGALIWFFTIKDDEAIKRFSETRRLHPLQKRHPSKSLPELIKIERDILTPMFDVADTIIDTTGLTPHELKRKIKQLLDYRKGMSVTVMSFGFKYGLPQHADNVFDVRFLPNPHFQPELREKSGLDSEVVDFLLKFPETQKFLEKLFDFVEFTIPLYEKEGKAYLTFAIGCTGGQHRSVAVAEELAEFLKEKFPDYRIYVEHREQGKRYEKQSRKAEDTSF